MAPTKKLLLLAAAAIASAGCAPRGSIIRKGEHTYDIAAAGKRWLYDAAFQVCRDEHQSGYTVKRPPEYISGGSRAVFACMGPIDSDEAAKFDRTGWPYTVTGTYHRGDDEVIDVKFGNGI